MFWRNVLCVFVFLICAMAGSDYRSEEGYPRGFISALVVPLIVPQAENMLNTVYNGYIKPNTFVLSMSVDCAKGPGSRKPVTIARSQLRHLYFVVQGRGRTRHKYTYWTAANIATDPRIDFNRKTIVIAIGYLDSTNFPISTMFANEYEQLGYNVILVDNQRFATVIYYLAARLMRPVGKHVAEVLVQLTRAGLDPSKLELLGFSLGGQTAGYIAKNFQRMTGTNVSRLTALEPAGPCFRAAGAGERLAAADADFVQAVHTNADGYGLAARVGHADFYVNGGEFQPPELPALPCAAACSHFRALPLWVAALRHPRAFLAAKCDSVQAARDALCPGLPRAANLMGNGVDVNNPGIFYLATTHSYPYYLGTKGLQPEVPLGYDLDDNETEVFT